MSDQPGDVVDVETCVVTIVEFRIAESDDGVTPTATEGGREYHESDEPRTTDLVELQGDRTALLGEQELETGGYAFLQLDVTGVDATLADGGEATVDTPGEAPLKFAQSFEIRADRTVSTADFTPVRRGGSGSYLLRPVASETAVSYESVGSTVTGTETSG